MNLKEIRKFKGFSQQKAANIAGVPLRTYKRYENEKSYKNTLKYSVIFDRIKNAKNAPEKNGQISYPKVTIIGAGFVGYHTGLMLSRKCKVSFVDINEEIINKINNEGFANAYLKLSEIKRLDIVILCVPTNLDEDTETLDTTNIENSLEEIYKINKYAAVIIKSTVPVGFTERMMKKFGTNISFMPEFLREKNALHDIFNPDRVIMGSDKPTVRIKNFAKCVENCIDISRKTIFMSTKEAEATKLFSNAYLAMRVAFFNELDSYAIKEGINTKKIIKSMGLDSRIGDFYNNPSFCFSGYCLPKDINNLKTQTKGDLLKSVLVSNEKRKEFISEKIVYEAFQISNNPTIGFYNLESKNKRVSSSIEILEIVRKYPVNVVVFDKNYPESMKDFNEFCKVSDLIVCNTYDDKLESVKSKVFTRDILSKQF